ncbi:MAG: Copper resistance protein CopC, partial [Symbiobacteriaceae bacterium]|nr:Copper resistance protein CopC [Symbiobacteriaceae bacterium]
MTSFAERFGYAARVVSGAFVGTLALAAILFLGTPVAQASDFLVNATYDAVDNNLGDSVCADAGGKCTLRAAIQNANKNADHDTIRLTPGTYLISLAGVGDDQALTGDLDILNAVTITGVMADGVTENPDATKAIVDGGQVDRVLSVGPYGNTTSFDATIKNLTIRNGKNTNTAMDDAYGGALDWASSGASTLTIDNAIIENSYATSTGGGMYLAGGANRYVVIRNTIVRGNSTASNGGGVTLDVNAKYDIYNSVFANNTAEYGAGLYSLSGPSDNYVVTISGTTFEGNTATQMGGGLYLTGPVNMVNSTISGNKSTNSRAGGMVIGLPSGSSATNMLRHVTVTGNTAAGNGGGIEANNGRVVLTLHNSIVAGNTGSGGYSDFVGTGSGTGLALIAANSSNNIVGSGSSLTASNGNKLGVSPDLKPLANNGGKGRTHEPNLTSPAKDAGNNAQVGGLTTDQRGLPRTYNGTVDIGAVEINPVPSATNLASSKTPSDPGESVTFTATVTGAGGTPTGTVTFKNGATVLDTKSLAAGVATFTTSGLAPGATHAITATYSGDAVFGSSTSAAVNQTVNKAGTTTAVSGSPNPAVHQQQVTLTATVTSTYAGTISGTVQFKNGGNNLGAPVTLSGGSATWTGTLPVGSHSITAVYAGDSTYNGSTSAAMTQTVNKAATSTALVSGPNPAVYPSTVTFTATVTSSAGTPTGTVSFKEGTTVLDTKTVNAEGKAYYAKSDFTVGTHNITAVYNGDGNFDTSTSAPLAQVLESAVTTTTVTTSKSPAALGESITYTATVTDAIEGMTPSGTVTFKSGATTLGTGTLNGSAQATFSIATLPIGTHTITAAYEGDSTFVTSSGTVSQVIEKGVTTTSVTASAPTPVFGQSVTLEATVAAAVPANGTPGGTVTFTMDGAPLGTVTLAGGKASVVTPALTVGDRAITVTYSSNDSFAASSTSYTLTVAQSPTAATLAGPAAASEYGQAATFTATVSVAGDGAGTPTGSVRFMEGATELANVTLTGSTASFSTSTMAPGSHTITAHYSGDANFAAAASNAFTQVVNKAVSTTTLASSKSATVYGENVRLTATITSSFGSPADGTVTFKAGSTVIGTASVVAGAAILNKADLAPGTYELTAVFSNSATATDSTSAAISQAVAKAPTTAALDVSPVGSSVKGESITFVAWVTPAHTGMPTGTITFMDGETVLSVEPVDAAGVAGFETDQIAVGSHQFKAVYNGDDNFLTSTSAVAPFGVGAADTDVTLTAAPGPTKYGEQVTFTATVTVESPGTGTPTGEVIFKEGAAELGRANLTG